MVFCQKCGTQLPDGTRFCTACGSVISDNPVQTSSQGMNFDFNTNTATAPANQQHYEYKVLTQKDKWFSGKFDPVNLEMALNAYAQQGWRVIGCATADIPGFGVTRQEFITILERVK
jgi:hypothetical protein